MKLPKTKVCGKCYKRKDISLFISIIKNGNMYFGCCKECKADYLKKYYENNKEIISERAKRYAVSNQLKVRAWKKNYYNKNKEVCGKRSAIQQKRERFELSNNYILNNLTKRLKMTREEVRQISGAIESKKHIIEARRLIKKLNHKIDSL